jgi:tRNA(Ile)-lysidine synthase
MASSRKRSSAEVTAAVRRALQGLRGKRFLVGLSGGVDSVTLLHALVQEGVNLRAAHINHGLSPNAARWAAFCRRLCRGLGIPLTVRRVHLKKKNEASARDARYAVLRALPFDVLALAHQLDDQAETVLMNLLRGAGVRGASGMQPAVKWSGRTLLRPLIDTSRESILAYAREHRLEWVEDESNASDAFTRNFIRLRIAPLLSARYPRWREALARAARHFSAKELADRDLLRAFLAAKGLRAPSEAKLLDMLRQLSSGGPRTLIEHDGTRMRLYRDRVHLEKPLSGKFSPVEWRGEPRLALPALGGELRFRRLRGKGIDDKFVVEGNLAVKLRSGGERLQPDARRPRRTLKNLFQEAGVPPWERERLPLIYRGEELVWAPGLGIDARYQSARNSSGWMPEWRVSC